MSGQFKLEMFFYEPQDNCPCAKTPLANPTVRWKYSLCLSGKKSVTLAGMSELEAERCGSLAPAIWQRVAQSPELYERLVLTVTGALSALAEDPQASGQAGDAWNNEARIGSEPKLNPLVQARSAFYEVFSDRNWETTQGFPKVIGAPAAIPVDATGKLKQTSLRAVHPAEQAAALAVLYQAIYRFLIEGERFVGFNAYTACFACAWQWYNLVKYLSVKVYPRQGAPSSPLYSQMRSELMEAYRAVSALLLDPRFAGAIRWLSYYENKEVKEGALLREGMRLSLPLIDTRWEVDAQGKHPKGEPLEPLDGLTPVHAPGWESGQMPGKVNWKNARLHREFEGYGGETPGKKAMRRLIVEWTLPRYDLENSLHLAHLLKRNESPRFPASYAGYTLVTLIFIGWVAVLSGWVVSQGGIHAPLWMKWTAALGGWLGAVELGLWLYSQVDGSAVPYLILPRLTGGITVGYLGLVLQGDSIGLASFFFRENYAIWVQWATVFSLWVGVTLAGWGYLYFDILPLVGSRLKREAARRAILILLPAWALAIFIGLFALAFAAHLYPTPANWVIFGPLGWVDYQMMLVFTPVSLFTGLVTQFIFEEKSVTASVWSPEQE